jgi:hypothetical protein
MVEMHNSPIKFGYIVEKLRLDNLHLNN